MPRNNPTDREAILEKAIEQMQRMFDHITNIYDQLRIKALGILAGEVALVTFMFSGDGVPVPIEPYGKIFYFAGVMALACGFGMLLWTLSPLEWKIPYDQHSSKGLKKYKSYTEFLEYLNDDHRVAVNHCMPLVSKRSRKFTWTLYMLSVGAIILLVIKYGGQP